MHTYTHTYLCVQQGGSSENVQFVSLREDASVEPNQWKLRIFYKPSASGVSLTVQWLRLRASTAGGMSSIHGWRTTCCMVRPKIIVKTLRNLSFPLCYHSNFTQRETHTGCPSPPPSACTVCTVTEIYQERLKEKKSSLRTTLVVRS